MQKPNESGFSVVVREEDTQEVLLKENFPKIAEAQDRQRELQEASAPEGIPTEVTIETPPNAEGQK